MRQRLHTVVDFWRFLLQRFLADRGISSAAALTYTTLFAVVPMMTVTFAMLSAVPAFQGVGEQIQRFVFRTFVPSAGAAVQEYLWAFTAQARQLTWVGVLLLAVTAVMMLMTIEQAFNTIWRVRKSRRGLSSFLLYWAILSLGPLLLGSGFVISTYLTSTSLLTGPDALVEAKTLLRFTPLLFSVAAFTLIYVAVPNARVPFKHALIGGVFTASLFEVAKAIFGLYVAMFPGYQLIYGAFATVPLFLLWLYLSWLIVLFGAELVCNLSTPHHWRRRGLPRLLVLLGVLRVFHQCQQSGQVVRHGDVQQAGWQLPGDEWGEVLAFLQAQQLICMAGSDAWVLSRDLSSYSLYQLISHSPWPLPRLEQLPAQLDEAWYADLREALSHLYAQESQLFSASLAQWLRTAQP
ncbi:MAG: YihY family inner membrane protein [Pseudomonas sp.]|nr:YihY family inner membrane protein [Pseudomonas sp.]